jgi:hypothetical protein
MKTFLLFLTLLTTPFFMLSQRRADKWYFGTLAGIDFSSGTATAISGGQINTPEGCATISDNLTGKLLFYTDGTTVWDSTHNIMNNGTGLLGATSSTQAALIVPNPANPNQYYIFTTDEIGGPNGLRYSIVDMTMQSGLGAVTAKNNMLLSNVTEKLTAVYIPSLAQYWIVAHQWGNNLFYAYKLSVTGLASPVISAAGIQHDSTVIQNTYGQMKFNGCGDRIACAVGYKDTIEVFDFDVATGLVSNPLTIPMADHVYGVEFSPDGNKLYAGQYGSLQTLFQFDLSLSTPAAILASKTPLSVTQDIYGMQLANDGKIYVVKSFSQFLGVINSPNIAGPTCNYVDQGLDLDPNFMGVMSSLSLPGFVQSFLNNEGNCVFQSVESLTKENLLNVYPNPANATFTVEVKEELSSLVLTDGTGKTIQQFSKPAAGKLISFGESLAPGIYFLKGESAEGSFVKKILKTEK